MRTLLLMRGIPASGKSSWIAEHNLELFTLSPDSLRLSFASPILSKQNTYAISQDNDKIAWRMLFEILEVRMKNGEFTVIDATHISHRALRAYEDLAQKYRYHIMVVDFSDVSLEQALKNNTNRGYKSVSEEVIRAMSENLTISLQSPLSSKYKIIKPSEADAINFTPIDLNKYEKIHHIGDLQGCFSVLLAWLKWQCNTEQKEQEKSHSKSRDSNEAQNIEQNIDYKVLFNPNEYYIFCGDYIDRGIENGLVMNAMLEIMELPNVCLLEGNHERWLRKWGEEELQKSNEPKPKYSTEFARFTLKELLDANFSQKDARKFSARLRQCALYNFDDKCVLATHGGLPSLPQNLMLVSTKGLIYGSGGYGDVDECTRHWEQSTPKNHYQAFGHRNREKLGMRANKRSFVLEGGVEFGGELRIATLCHIDCKKQRGEVLDIRESSITHSNKKSNFTESSTKTKANKVGTKEISNKQNLYLQKDEENLTFALTQSISPDGWQEISVSNPVHRNNADSKNAYEIMELVENLRQSAFVREKQYFEGRICSFNFNQKAFYNKAWDSLTCKARGLFIDIISNKVVARSFDKFFNLNEVPQTQLENLQTLAYPLKCFVKENGFLGILSVDRESNELFITSKSDPSSDFSGYFKEILFNTLNEKMLTMLKDTLMQRDISLVFEVIDPVRDPHIIKYDKPQLILLDGFANAIQTRRVDFRFLCDLAKKLGIAHKIKACEIGDFKELQSFINKVQDRNFLYDSNDFIAFFEAPSENLLPITNEQKRHIEGFVIEDSNGFMFKLKLHHYTMWKALRGAVQMSKAKQQMILPKFIKDIEAVEFFAWLTNLVESSGFSVLENSIISLREQFLQSRA